MGFPVLLFLLLPFSLSEYCTAACPAGEYFKNSSCACVACLPGHYCPLNCTAPIPCPIGTAGSNPSQSSADDCAPCSPGWYSPHPGFSSCIECPLGYWCPDALSEPLQCPPGTYTASSGSVTCLTCLGGQYCSTPSLGSIPCPFGTFSGPSSVVCTVCPDGTYTPSEGSISCRDCPPGSFCTGGLRTDCPPGSFSTGGMSYCSSCPAGTHQVSYGSSSCDICPPGKYCGALDAVEVDCPAGTYSPGNGTAFCAVCPEGTYQTSVGQSSCLACEAGKRCLDPKDPVDCVVGTYSPEGVSECLGCPPGYECTSPELDPVACGVGFYGPGGVVSSCLPCEDGTYADISGSVRCLACGFGSNCVADALPTPCPKGQFSPDSGTDCAPCADNYYSDEVGSPYCFPCPAGYECPEKDAAVPCSAEGMYSPGLEKDCLQCAAGSASSIDHTACLPCPAGYECSDPLLGPVGCASGEYSLGGASSCTPCPAGSECPSPSSPPLPCGSGYSGPSQTNCTLCPEGMSCVDPSLPPELCEDGETSPLGVDNCYECAPGSTCSDALFLQCRPGTYPDATSSMCLGCPAGKRCLMDLPPIDCISGFYSLENETVCHPCPAGYMCSTTTDVPTECASGEYSDELSTSCSVCPAGFWCPNKAKRVVIPCDPGYYSDAGQAVCDPCPAGEECPNPFAGAPAPCGAGTYSLGLQQACIDCPAGYYCPTTDAAPLVCPEGYWSSVGLDACDICTAGYHCLDPTREIECPRGTISAAGAISCDLCPEGYYCDGVTATDCPLGYYCPEGEIHPVPCPAGYYATSTLAARLNDTCVICTEGYYCNKLTTNPSLNACPTGHYCPVGTKHSAQYPCPAGTYNALTTKFSLDECLPCPATKFCPPGTTTPMDCLVGHYCPMGTPDKRSYPCPAGSWTNSTLQSSVEDCIECGLGMYCPVGSHREIGCPIGTFQPGINATELGDCLPCLGGYYCPTTGISDSTLYPCPRGHYCPNGTANPYLYPCPAGTWTNSTSLSVKTDCFICFEGFACLDGSGALNPSGSSNYQDMVPCSSGHYCPGQPVYGTETLGSYSGEYTQYPTQYPCPRGTFTERISLTDSSECTTCPGGSYCVGGMSRPSGSCSPGRYCPAGSHNTTAFPCPAGTYTTRTDASALDHCEECPVGKYCPEGCGTPIDCPAGTYRDVNGSQWIGPVAEGGDECFTCPGGYYCLDGQVNPIPCGIGRYSEPGQIACVDCPAGHFCPVAATNMTDMETTYECPAGSYCYEGMEIIPTGSDTCPKAHYCPAGSSAPINCTIGTYNDAFGKSSETDCQSCTAGFYCLEGTISPHLVCSPGHYCPSGSYGPEQVACPRGTHRSTEGAAAVGDCDECPEGYYCPIGSVDPIWCPEGWYCVSGSFEPEPCPLGTYGDGLRLTAVSECTDCPPGLFCNGLALHYATGPCDPGYYCLSRAYTSRPTDGVTGDLCPAGGYCELGSAVPVSCDPGSFNNETGGATQEDCQPCTAGYYCQGSNLPQPTGPCDAGYYCDGGAALPTQHQAPPGTFAESGAPEPTDCPMGEYNPEPRQSSCRPCEPGFYCPTPGLRYQYVCPIGRFCDARTIDPEQTKCPRGTFSPQEGLYNYTQCLDCPPGKYCELEGLSEPTGPCAPGHYCTGGTSERNPDGENGGICPAGKFCPNGTASPKLCPPGTYSNQPELDDILLCTPCDPGKFCPDSAMTSTVGYECAPGYYCDGGSMTVTQHICQPGFYCEAGSSDQEPCPAGTYSPTIARSSCLDCPEGFYCPFVNPTHLPIESPPGFYCPEGVSTPEACPAGSYSNLTGLYNMSQCSLCDGGAVCSVSNLTAPDGLCDPGYYCVRGALSTTGGLIVELGGGESGDCLSGHYCPQGSIQSIPCPAGTFSPFENNPSLADCQNCTAGMYCLAVGSDSETGDCSPGYYCVSGATISTPNDGITGDVCPAGTFCVAGSPFPENCPPGEYQPSVASSSCLVCPAGSYCEGNNTTPDDCPVGYFCPLGTSTVTSSLACVRGSFSNVTNLRNVTECLRCRGGQYCDGTALDAPTGLCAPGYYCREGATDEIGSLGTLGGQSGICDPGYYCPRGSSVKLPCPLGTYNPSYFMSNLTACLPCDPGMYCDDVGLEYPTGNCSEGFYCSGGGAEVPNPLDGVTGNLCPRGQVCSAGTIDPEDCPDATFAPSLGMSECLPCPAGFFCGTATSDPEVCPPGEICPEGSGTTYGFPLRHFCPPGSFSNRTGLTNMTQCSLCSAGLVCSVAGLVEPDLPCDAGYYCVVGSSEVNSSLGILGGIEGGLCPSGNYCPSGSGWPLRCPRGTFRPGTGGTNVSDCDPCTAGFYCGEMGLDSVSGECDHGYFCPPGQSVPNPSEFLCYEGHYCLNGTEYPEVCPPALFQPFRGRNECILCPPRQYCRLGVAEICPQLSYCGGGNSDPVPCPDGTYSHRVGLEFSSECLSCPPGKYCTNGNITDDCAAGHICYFSNPTPTPLDTDMPRGRRCPRGFYCPAGVEYPIACSGAKVGTVVGGMNETVCNECPAGFYCVDGYTVPHDCPLGFYCPGGEDPIACPNRTYNPNVRAVNWTDCLDCRPGYLCDRVAMATDVVKRCPPGHYCPSRSALPTRCPNGTFNEFTRGGSFASCELCPGGYFCLEAAMLPFECGPAVFCPNGSDSGQVCPPRYYCPPRTEFPIVCPASYYCPRNSSYPTYCPEGTYCPGGTDVPIPCPAGYMFHDSGQRDTLAHSCLVCPKGTYATGDHLQCLPCHEGYYCSREGVSTPTPSDPLDGGSCSPGHYCPEGSWKEYACPEGTSQSEFGQGNCSACVGRDYSHLPGSEYCQVCGEKADPSEDHSTCVCIGANRGYQFQSGECLCDSGFVYFDGLTQSTNDSNADCQPIVFEKCYSTQSRSIRGICVDDDGQACDSFCVKGGGSVVSEIGICECDQLINEDEMCDESCRQSMARFMLEPYEENITWSVDTNLSSTVFGRTKCPKEEPCEFKPMRMDANGFLGVYDPPQEYFESLFSGSSRRAPVSDLRGVYQPLVCLEYGEGILWELSEDGGYPIFLKDSVVHSTTNFDSTAFRILADLSESDSKPSLFAYSFTDPGVYIFADRLDLDRYIVVRVMDTGESCPDSASFKPLTASNSVFLGIRRRTDMMVLPDMYLVMVILAFVVVFLAGLVVVIHCFRTRQWSISKRIQVPARTLLEKDKVRSQGGLFANPETLWTSATDAEMAILETAEDFSAAEETEYELHTFGTEIFEEKFEEFMRKMVRSLDKHRRGFMGKYHSLLHATEMVRHVLGKVKTRSKVDVVINVDEHERKILQGAEEVAMKPGELNEKALRSIRDELLEKLSLLQEMRAAKSMDVRDYTKMSDHRVQQVKSLEQQDDRLRDELIQGYEDLIDRLDRIAAGMRTVDGRPDKVARLGKEFLNAVRNGERDLVKQLGQLNRGRQRIESLLRKYEPVYEISEDMAGSFYEMLDRHLQVFLEKHADFEVDDEEMELNLAEEALLDDIDEFEGEDEDVQEDLPEDVDRTMKYMREVQRREKKVRRRFAEQKRRIVADADAEFEEQKKNVEHVLDQMSSIAVASVERRYHNLAGAKDSDRERLRIVEEGRAEADRVREMIDMEKQQFVRNLEAALKKKKVKQLLLLKKHEELMTQARRDDTAFMKDELKEFDYQMGEVDQESSDNVGELVLRKRELLVELYERKSQHKEEVMEERERELNRFFEENTSTAKAASKKHAGMLQKTMNESIARIEEAALRTHVSENEKNRILRAFGEEKQRSSAVIQGFLSQQHSALKERLERVRADRMDRFQTEQALRVQRDIEGKAEDLDRLKTLMMEGHRQSSKNLTHRVDTLRTKKREEVDQKLRAIEEKFEEREHHLEEVEQTELENLEEEEEESMQQILLQSEDERQKTLALKNKLLDERLNDPDLDEHRKQQVLARFQMDVQQYEENMEQLKQNQLEEVRRKMASRKKELMDRVKAQRYAGLKASLAAQIDKLGAVSAVDEILADSSGVEVKYTQRDFEERRKMKQNARREAQKAEERFLEQQKKETEEYERRLRTSLEEKKKRFLEENRMKLHTLRSKMDAEIQTSNANFKGRIMDKYQKQREVLQLRQKEELIRQSEEVAQRIQERRNRASQKRDKYLHQMKETQKKKQERLRAEQRSRAERRAVEQFLTSGEVTTVKEAVTLVIGSRQRDAMDELLAAQEKEAVASSEEGLDIVHLQQRLQLLKKHVDEQNDLIAECQQYQLAIRQQSDFEKEINDRLQQMEASLESEKRANRQKLDEQKSKLRLKMEDDLKRLKTEMSSEMHRIQKEIDQTKSEHVRMVAEEEKNARIREIHTKMETRKNAVGHDRERMLARCEQEMIQFADVLEDVHQSQMSALKKKIQSRSAQRHAKMTENAEKRLDESFRGTFKVVEDETNGPSVELAAQESPDQQERNRLLTKLRPHLVLNRRESPIHKMLQRLSLVEQVLEKDVVPIFHDFVDEKKIGENEGHIEVVEPSQLDPHSLVVFEFGNFVLGLIARKFKVAVEFKVVVARTLPTTSAQNNCFRSSFFYNRMEKILFVRDLRLKTVGKYTLVLVHCFSHILIGDMRNDANPSFVHNFYAMMECLCEDFFLMRQKRINLRQRPSHRPLLEQAQKIVDRDMPKFARGSVLFRMKEREKVIEREKRAHT